MDTGADGTVRLLRALRYRNNVKAVVLRINSPGGTVAASQEIYDEVKALKEAGKKVVVSMGDVAASGGYYISAPANYIFASPGTLTGSIGVIMSLMDYEPVLKCIEKNGSKSAEGIKNALVDLGDNWMSGLMNDDDITLVVIKKKN